MSKNCYIFRAWDGEKTFIIRNNINALLEHLDEIVDRDCK